MAMKILALDGLNDSKLCKLVSSLIQTIDGVEYANIDYLSQKLTLQLSSRDSSKIIASVSNILKENMPGVTIKFKEVSEFDEKKQATKDVQKESGMSLNLAKAISTMMKEEATAEKAPPKHEENSKDAPVKKIVSEPVIEIIPQEEKPVVEESESEEELEQGNPDDLSNEEVEQDEEQEKESEDDSEFEEGENQNEKKESLFAFINRLIVRLGKEMVINLAGIGAGIIFFLISIMLTRGSVAEYIISIIAFIILSVFALLGDLGKYKTSTLVTSLITVTASVCLFFFGERLAATLSIILYHGAFFGVYFIYEHFSMSMEKSLDVKPKLLKKVKDGNIELVNFDDVWSGDEIALDKGDVVPFDSIIVDGETMVDDSLISGKSDPIEAKQGAFLNCGSKIVGDTIRIAMVGLQENSIAAVARKTILEDTAEDTQTTHKAKRLSYLLIMIEILLFLIFCGVNLILGKVDTFVKLLPTVILLLSPVGVVAGVKALQRGSLGKALRNGIILVSTEFLEEIASAKTIVTGFGGVLTGKTCKVSEVKVAEDFEEEDLIQAAAYTESKVEHPMATAILDYYTNEYGKQVLSSHVAFCESFENGVRAMAEARIISVGNDQFMKKADVDIPLSNDTGKLCAHVAKYSDYMGTIFFKEEKREGADHLARALKNMGFQRTVLLSARDESVVEIIGRKLGYDEIYSSCSKAKKLERISEILQIDIASGVVFAGEVNDCETLSDICPCVAMGEGSFSSMLYAAKMIIPSGEVKKLIKAMKICKNVQLFSMLNIGIAAGLKIISLILALVGLLPFPLAMLINALLMIFEAGAADINLHT